MTDMGVPTELSCAGEDGMHQYIQDIGTYPRLSPEEEKKLAIRCAAGDTEAVKLMVSSNLQLVVSIARQYSGRGVPVLDLIQEGSIGLIAAAKKFDPERNIRFSTYATKWIWQGVVRCVMDHSGMIRIPHYTAERMYKIFRLRADLLLQQQEEPSPRQLALLADMEEEKVSELLRLYPDVCSLDGPVGENSDLQSLLEDLQAAQPEEELVRRELKNTIEAILTRLTQRQQQVLRLYYGMDDGVCYSMEAIGKQLGISKQRVREIRQQAVEKMKELGGDFGLEDFWLE